MYQSINEYVNLQEAKNFLGYSFKTIGFLIQTESIKALKIGKGQYLMKMADLIEFKNNICADKFQFAVANRRQISSMYIH